VFDSYRVKKLASNFYYTSCASMFWGVDDALETIIDSSFEI